MAPKVIVAGGGVVGCAVAYYLAGAGCSVSLYERNAIGSGATSAAAGILAPLAESAEPGPFFDLALAGLRVFQEDAAGLEEVAGISVEYTPSGVVRPAYSTAHTLALHRSLELAAASRLPAAWLEPAECARLEPELSRDSLLGAMFSREEAHVRPSRLAVALAQGATRRGAVISEGMEAVALPGVGGGDPGVRLPGNRVENADVVVVCGGVWSAPIAAGALRVLHPVRGQYLLLRGVSQPLRRVVFGEECYVVPRRNGTLYVGATEEPEAGFRAAVTAAGMQHLLSAATAMIPALAPAQVVGTGAGLRPATQDRLPILGRSALAPGLVYAAGHFRNGVLLSLITGRLIAELVAHGRTSVDLAPFSPDRPAPARPATNGRSAGSTLEA